MILWQWMDRPGHEASRVDGTTLSGAAVFSHDGTPVRLDYAIVCDPNWITLRAEVTGWIGDRSVSIAIEGKDGRWTLNGEPQPQVDGCIDVDLNFSPCTNLLPIRRLSLAIGDEAPVRAAWLRFPSMQLEPLSQTYRRLGENEYRYTSGDGAFSAELTVNGQGMVVDYAGIWKAV